MYYFILIVTQVSGLFFYSSSTPNFLIHRTGRCIISSKIFFIPWVSTNEIIDTVDCSQLLLWWELTFWWWRRDVFTVLPWRATLGLHMPSFVFLWPRTIFRNTEHVFFATWHLHSNFIDQLRCFPNFWNSKDQWDDSEVKGTCHQP